MDDLQRVGTRVVKVGRRSPLTLAALRKLRFSRFASLIVYSLVAKHLPRSYRPGGGASRFIRYQLAKAMFDHCGDDVNLEHGAAFGSGAGIRVGDRSDIGTRAIVLGPVTIGNDVMMGPRCLLIAGDHNFADVAIPMNQQGLAADRPIVIEDDVWIGAAAIILPGRVIGRGSIVGAGSVVTRDVAPFSIVGGNPARPVGERGMPSTSVQPDPGLP